MSVNTSIGGIFQLDVIIRTAIIQALRELRKKPELLDYCFASLPQDELTAVTYGQGSIDKAKEWFIKTEIPVSLGVRIGSPQFPIISIELRDESELEQTLGDVHYDVSEDIPGDTWPSIAGPFACLSYDTTTGDVKLPLSVTDSFLIFPGMVLVDRNGVVCPIVSTVNETTVNINPVVADFSVTYLRYPQVQNRNSLESLAFRGTVGIGCHVQGEPEILLWLKSIVLFILLRYKQTYFEARGFERSTLQLSGFGADLNWGVENVYTQTITMTGHYRQFWPKSMGLIPQGFIGELQIATGMQSPPGTDLLSQPWTMDADDDILDGLKRIGPIAVNSDDS